MSAKDQILQLVDYFKKKPQLKDKTDAMGDGLLLGANLADEANELSKSVDDSFKRLQQEYTENGNGSQSTAELIAARDGELVVNDRLNRDSRKVDLQLVETALEINSIKKSNIYMSDFPKLEGEIDDTQRLQRAVDSFEGNIGGVINVHEILYVSGQIKINLTGLKLKGLNNKKSRIISSYSGTTFWVEPLYNGAPYTNTGYCKFYIDDVDVSATGDAIETGVGLYLKWIFASSFNNLYVRGFKRDVVFKGSHLNTFYNFYAENADATDLGVEIHNRGVAVSADGEIDEAGETTSNNNTFIGGWIHNSSLDFRNMLSTKFEHVDIEPASDSIFTGDLAIFTKCRFERFNYYAVALDAPPYGKFPWFEVGNSCKFYDNEYHQSGAHETPENPIFKINGSFNEIEYPQQASYDTGIANFSVDAKSNTLDIKKSFNDYAKTLNNLSYKNELDSVTGSIIDNVIKYYDFKESTSTEYANHFASPKGVFTSYSRNNTDLTNLDVWAQQGVEVTELLNTELQYPKGYEDNKFYKMRVIDSQAVMKRLVLAANIQKAKTPGVYTMVLTLYIPSSASVPPRFSPKTGTTLTVNTRDRWVTLQERGYFDVGDDIQPQIVLEGGLNDTVYFGMLNVVKGNVGAFFPNTTGGEAYKKFS